MYQNSSISEFLKYQKCQYNTEIRIAMYWNSDMSQFLILKFWCIRILAYWFPTDHNYWYSDICNCQHWKYQNSNVLELLCIKILIYLNFRHTRIPMYQNSDISELPELWYIRISNVLEHTGISNTSKLSKSKIS